MFAHPFAALAVFLALLSPLAEAAPAKPFKRALVIGGGGISPGVALGIIEGARAAGYEPDLIIATCGASLGATAYQSFGNADAALAYLRSPAYHRNLLSLVQIDSQWGLDLKAKLDQAEAQPGVLPELFTGNILRIPETVGRLLPRENFAGGRARLILTAAKADFGKESAGTLLSARSFKQVYFTDPATASYLRGKASPIHRLFPGGHVAPGTEVISGVTMSQAARASIADPFFVNPARVGNSYYFTGAVDLFPIETAQDLAQQVLVTYPSGKYSDYEDLAISSTLGFKQSARSALAARHTRVKWIDVSGLEDLVMDPAPAGLLMVNNIPSSPGAYAAAIDNQYSFGYWRAVEAVKVQAEVGNVRSHLRRR